MNIDKLFNTTLFAAEDYQGYTPIYRKIIEADDALADVKYGQLNRKTMKSIKDDDSDEDIIVLKPEQLMKYKVGTCWDQSLYTYARLKHNIGSSNVIALGWFMWLNNGECTSHTTVIAKDNDKYYWSEHAWHKQMGINGPYKSIDEAMTEIKSFLPKYKKIIWKNNINSAYDKLLSQKDDITCKQFLKEVFGMQ